MSKQINIRIPDELKSEIERIIDTKETSLGKFIADAITLAVTVENNMDSKAHSRLVIENAKDQPKDYKLLLKAT
jgi:metal-responsive CopG/Arc/MetJ family transcriptional regulator